jgi:formylglycine-generating enzyme required for sulfatase activity
MRLVPAGIFPMGSNDGEANEKPIHDVYLNGYYIDQYEVTNVFYKACVDAGVCEPPKAFSSNARPSYYGNPSFDTYPVVYVSWTMAKTYCEWRGATLPTEAQWEKAARGTDGRTYPWGEKIDNTFANYFDYVHDTSSVGSYPSGISPYGLYDMAGNVWEWVSDWYLVNYYLYSSLENPFGPDTGQFRVLRGGSWEEDSDDVRSSHRDRNIPTYSMMVQYGFRCARPAP